MSDQHRPNRGQAKSKRFVLFRRPWFRKERNNLLSKAARGSPNTIPNHVILNIFDAMYYIEQHLGKLDATKIYQSHNSIQPHELTEFCEMMLAIHKSNYAHKLNTSAIESIYVLGEAVKHVLSLLDPLVPPNLYGAFMSITGGGDIASFMDSPEWDEFSGKLIMGIFVHLAKVSYASSNKDHNNISVSILSCIFGEILFPTNDEERTSAKHDMFQNAKVRTLSMILRYIHGSIPSEAGSKEVLSNYKCLKEKLDGSARKVGRNHEEKPDEDHSEKPTLCMPEEHTNATEDESTAALPPMSLREPRANSSPLKSNQDSVTSTACSPIRVVVNDPNSSSLPIVKRQEQQSYKEIMERARCRIQNAKVVVLEVDQALVQSSVVVDTIC